MSLKRRIGRLEQSAGEQVDLVTERQMIERWLNGEGPPPSGDRVIYLRNWDIDPDDPDRIMLITQALGKNRPTVVGPSRWPPVNSSGHEGPEK